MGVAVVIEASHMCMQMRGIEKQQSATTTSAFTGVFLSSAPKMRSRGRGLPGIGSSKIRSMLSLMVPIVVVFQAKEKARRGPGFIA
jgi:hypothetical protein